MSPTVYIVPKEGALVRDPLDSNKALPPEGKSVEWNTHWERRRREGDISIVDPAAPAAKKK